MNLYIHSAGIVSPAGDNGDGQFLAEPPAYDTDRLLCKEPDYKSYIPPMQLRRMSKVVRMGIGAAKICLDRSGLRKPSAISVGTALGCLHDTEVFLSKMIAQDEQLLTPTAFIQSTHNTVAGQIALFTGCHGHNMTVVQRGHSFEQAMIDAHLYLTDYPGESVLVGGIDELTETSFRVMGKAAIYRQSSSTPATALADHQPGSLAGEGAAFFSISDTPPRQDCLAVRAVSTFVSRDPVVVAGKVSSFLSDQLHRADDVDFVLLGINGDQRSSDVYTALKQGVFSRCRTGVFKHLCGEYPTASAFGLGVLDAVARGSNLTAVTSGNTPGTFCNMVMVNNFMHHYSCWLLEAVPFNT